MKKLLGVLLIAFLCVASSETLEDEELSSIEPEEVKKSDFEWFSGIRGYLGLSGGYLGSQHRSQIESIARIDKPYLLLSSGLPLKYAFSNFMIYDRDGQLASENEPLSGYTLNLVFGTEIFFLANYLGVRLEGGLGYISLSATLVAKPEGKARKAFQSYLTTFLGLDLIGNVYVSEQYDVGLFAGVETSYSFLIKATRDNGNVVDITEAVRERETMIDIFARFGITTLLYEHHRLEFVAKIPVAYVAFRPEGRDFFEFTALEKTSLNVAYKYLF